MVLCEVWDCPTVSCYADMLYCPTMSYYSHTLAYSTAIAHCSGGAFFGADGSTRQVALYAMTVPHIRYGSTCQVALYAMTVPHIA
eukprot:75811-Rhodomonas_salina.2